MKLTRRHCLRNLGGGLLAATLPVWPGGLAGGLARAAAGEVQQRSIPSSGETVPAIGLGSWITFDVPPAEQQRRQRCFDVIRAFLQSGGTLIDSSPMYGYAQELIGAALRRPEMPKDVFSATKVWIPGAGLGEAQMEQAMKLWGVEKFDLIHVHNMVDWQSHLAWLQRWKAEGRVRYLGITTSHGRRHGEMLEVIHNQPFDFVQFTYNLADREAEQRLLPAAQEHGKAVVINRPFRGGDLFRQVRGRSLPDWAAELGCETWSQFFLVWIIAHPAVTCAIPATSNPDHLRDNMAALRLSLPNEARRAAMLEWFLGQR